MDDQHRKALHRALHIFQGAAARWADRPSPPARGALIETIKKGATHAAPIAPRA